MGGFKEHWREFLASFLGNLVFPVVWFYSLAEHFSLPPLWSLFLGLSPAIGVAIFWYARHRKLNVLSLLTVTSRVFLLAMSGFALNGAWYAVQSALLPWAMAGAILATRARRAPVVQQVLITHTLLDQRVVLRLKNLKIWITSAGNQLVFGLLLNGALNIWLNLQLVNAPLGTEAFNEQLGLSLIGMTLFVAPYIWVINGHGVFKLYYRIRKATGLTYAQLLGFVPSVPASEGEYRNISEAGR